MILELLSRDPLLFVAFVIAIVSAISIHEFSHAYIATKLGDSTPGNDGRLTLNPLAHLDIFGFLFLLLAGFGWGKPVVFNPFNIRFPRFGPTYIALAGPGSNFIAALFFGSILSIFSRYTTLSEDNLLMIFLVALVHIHIILGVFNLFPIPPLDGSKLLFALLPPRFDTFKESFERIGPIVLIALILLDSWTRVGFFQQIFDAVLQFVFRLVI